MEENTYSFCLFDSSLTIPFGFWCIWEGCFFGLTLSTPLYVKVYFEEMQYQLHFATPS